MFNEREYLKVYIDVVEKTNKDAGIDLTGKEEEVLQRARWAFILNAVSQFKDNNVKTSDSTGIDNLSILLNFVKFEKGPKEISVEESFKELREVIQRIQDSLQNKNDEKA